MNGYQRIQAVLRGEWPDRRPVMLHNFMAAAREAGMTQAQYRSSPENIARAHIEAVEKYGLDGVLIDVDTATLAGALGVPVEYPEDEPARCHGQLLENLAEAGQLATVDISKNERVMIWVEACRLLKNYFGDEICGSTEAILEDMLETGADAFELDYKTDVNAIRRVYGDKVVLSGNIDPSGVLALGTPEQVATTTRTLLEAYRESPRLIVCSGCALPSTTPEANLRAIIRIVREWSI